LKELTQQSPLKEALTVKLKAKVNHMSSINTDYENRFKDLQQQISDLQKERDDLMHQLQNNHQNE
jgi:uncharacterized protein YeeX (DUF496 family)